MLTFKMFMKQHSFFNGWMDILEKQSNFLWQKIYGFLVCWGWDLNIQPHDKCSTIWSLNYQDKMLSSWCFLILAVVNIQGIYLWCWYSKWYLCSGNCILFLTDDEWMFLRNSHFLWQKLQGVSTQNLRIHANALPFEVDYDLSLCHTE